MTQDEIEKIIGVNVNMLALTAWDDKTRLKVIGTRILEVAGVIVGGRYQEIYDMAKAEFKKSAETSLLSIMLSCTEELES